MHSLISSFSTYMSSSVAGDGLLLWMVLLTLAEKSRSSAVGFCVGGYHSVQDFEDACWGVFSIPGTGINTGIIQVHGKRGHALNVPEPGVCF
jgi:hypothetical protein